jgi:hypothetical protein
MLNKFVCNESCIWKAVVELINHIFTTCIYLLQHPTPPFITIEPDVGEIESFVLDTYQIHPMTKYCSVSDFISNVHY